MKTVYCVTDYCGSLQAIFLDRPTAEHYCQQMDPDHEVLQVEVWLTDRWTQQHVAKPVIARAYCTVYDPEYLKYLPPDVRSS